MKRKPIIKVVKEDNNFQRFEVIKRNRKKRYKNREFYVEGVKNINEAIRNDWEISSFLYPEGQRLSDWARNILKNVKADGIYELSKGLMDKLSDKENSSEIIAFVKMKEDNANRIKLEKNPFIVVFDRPSNRGNLGTIIRSCDAFECNGLIITGHAVDLYDPETIVSSVGSFFSLPTLRLPSYKQVYDWIETLKIQYSNLQIIGTSAHGDCNVNQCDFSKPTIVLIGNETIGLSRNYIELSDSLIKIPIGGYASSLNVSCAASIVLYEVKRQRYL